MIWIVTTAILYALTSGIALFLICSGDAAGKEAYYDVRNIGVALFWPVVLSAHGIWVGGKRIFREKLKTDYNGTTDGGSTDSDT